MAVILIDQAAANEWLMPLMVAAGVLLTLYLCKAAGVPYINARIGGVTFVLVACTLPGTARIWYGVFRLVSTMYAVLVKKNIFYTSINSYSSVPMPIFFACSMQDFQFVSG